MNYSLENFIDYVDVDPIIYSLESALEEDFCYESYFSIALEEDAAAAAAPDAPKVSVSTSITTAVKNFFKTIKEWVTDKIPKAIKNFFSKNPDVADDPNAKQEITKVQGEVNKTCSEVKSDLSHDADEQKLKEGNGKVKSVISKLTNTLKNAKETVKKKAGKVRDDLKEKSDQRAKARQEKYENDKNARVEAAQQEYINNKSNVDKEEIEAEKKAVQDGYKKAKKLKNEQRSLIRNMARYDKKYGKENAKGIQTYKDWEARYKELAEEIKKLESARAIGGFASFDSFINYVFDDDYDYYGDAFAYESYCEDEYDFDDDLIAEEGIF